MMNLRAMARSAISTIVRTWRIPKLRSVATRRERLNSSAITTVKIMPNTTWKVA
ncbi:hypothetical protein D3C77_246570 [compost metagenome]